jgi:thiamine-monophosphate kinase
MSLGEFELIKRYFQNNTVISDNGVALGIGDDCAILDVPDGYQLAVTTDTLVSGVHFLADVDPYRLGYKALAVNLSDLAAMGATPKWVSLAITLPSLDEGWLAEFSRGFFELADKFNVTLVGGDTTSGPLSITVSVKGITLRGRAVQRSQANVDDLICVSGTLGDGGVGLACKLNELSVRAEQYFIDALELTEPRVELGLLLPGLASSCIDISDGLAQDLKHILKASHCAALLQLDKLPLSSELREEVAAARLSQKQALQYALTGGDDYELLFTISDDNFRRLQGLCGGDITVIGRVVKEPGALQNEPLIQLFLDKQLVSFAQQGWDHFQQGNK